MVQIIPPGFSFGSELGKNLGSGLREGYFQGQESKQKRLAQENEDNTLKRMGIDMAGISDPKLREKYLAAALQGANAKELENLRQEGKFNRIKEDQTFVSQLFAGKKPQNTLGSQLASGGEQLDQRTPEQDSQENFQYEFSPEQLSDSDIALVSSRNPQLGRLLQDQKDLRIREKRETEKSLKGVDKEKRRQYEADREFHSKTSTPITENATRLIQESQVKKGLNKQLRRDISSGKTSGLYPFIIDKLGLESFRDPESARFTSEIKNKFVESLSDIPNARPNIFLERVLSTAQPQIGRSIEANLTTLELSDFMDDMKEEHARKVLELAKKDEKDLGYVRNDVSQRALDQMGNYANKRQEQMAYDIRKTHEDNLKDDELLNEIISGNIVPDTPVTKRSMRFLMIKNGNDPEKAIKEAKKLGFVFPSKEIYNREDNE